MFTNLQLYYLQLPTPEEKSEFKEKVLKDTGLAPRSFYRLLQNEPDKLKKKYLAETTGIAEDLLYKVTSPKQFKKSNS